MTILDIHGFVFVTSKSDTIVVLRDFLTRIKNVFFTSVKTLKTDNGS